MGSIVADIGCGNGKYLGCNPDIVAIGSDQYVLGPQLSHHQSILTLTTLYARSTKLIEICKSRGFESLVADGLHLPFRDQSCVRI